MLTNILVPLDGSKLAETALSPAVSLASTLGAPITFLHIIEKDAPQSIHADHHISKVDEAENYLNNIVTGLNASNLKITNHVHAAEVKDVASSIVHHATEEYEQDLIVLCAHGSGGIRDVVFGNIAQQVIALGQTPVLLLQPQTTETRPFTIKKIFVPLDSESKHDISLNFAQELAKAYNSEIYFLTVVPTFNSLTGHDAAMSTLLPSTSIALFDILEEEAKEHLQIHLSEFIDAGYKVKAEIGRGDPAEVI